MGYDMYWVKPDPDVKKRHEEAMARVRELWQIRDALPAEEKGKYGSREESIEAFVTGAAPANASDRYRQAQQEAHDAYEAAQALDVNYFRLNIGGMGAYRQVMVALDMCVDAADHRTWKRAPWEDTPESSSTWDKFYEWENGAFVDSDIVERWSFAEYAKASEEYKSWSPDDQGRIPLFKFGSNDGWVVTPAECRVAVTKAYDASSEEIRGYFYVAYQNGWSAFNATDKQLDDTMQYWWKWIAFMEGAAEHEGFEVR